MNVMKENGLFVMCGVLLEKHYLVVQKALLGI